MFLTKKKHVGKLTQMVVQQNGDESHATIRTKSPSKQISVKSEQS